VNADNTQDPSHDAKLPAQAGSVETMGTRHGMFGVSGTGDTSGYGGLVKQTVFPGPSQRPSAMPPGAAKRAEVAAETPGGAAPPPGAPPPAAPIAPYPPAEDHPR